VRTFDNRGISDGRSARRLSSCHLICFFNDFLYRPSYRPAFKSGLPLEPLRAHGTWRLSLRQQDLFNQKGLSLGAPNARQPLKPHCKG
jgi:hypothetical protein